MNPELIIALTKLGIDLAEKLIEKRTGKPISALTTEEMLAEIEAVRSELTDSGQIFDAAAGP